MLNPATPRVMVAEFYIRKILNLYETSREIK
jgi:hypothetical protein